MPRRFRNAFAAVAVLAAGVSTSEAALTELTSRPVAEDTIYWSQLGVPLTDVPTPVSFTSVGNIIGTASLNNNGTAQLYEQCCAGITGTFDGNFSPGDIVFYTDKSGPLTLAFDTPVQIAGAQILDNVYGPFTAQIEAFSGKTLLGTFSESGVTTTSADGSAIFLGVEDLSEGITSVEFSITEAPEGRPLTDFAINQVTLQARSVPEPSTWAMMLLGFAGLGYAGYRSTRKAVPIVA